MNRSFLPVLATFFVMGVVDFVGIATNYVKLDFALSDTLANTLPMSVFVWFALFSIPTGMLMDRIGRKRTVLLSLALTGLGLVLPLLSYTFASVLAAFGLIGIGNTVLQTSLNPLVSNVVSKERLTSSLTLGQFVKATASFLGPLLSASMAGWLGDWKLAFLLFAAATLLSGLWLHFSPVPREEGGGARVGFRPTLALLADGYVLMLFGGVLAIVSIDVGLNTSLPRLLMDRTDMELADAGLGTVLYFVARTAGALAGAVLLTLMRADKFLRWNMLGACLALAALLAVDNVHGMYAAILVLGFTCANVFSVLFSYALRHKAGAANEVSALMIMGVAGGALIMPLLGAVADRAGQTAGVGVLLVCLLYLLAVAFKVERPMGGG